MLDKFLDFLKFEKNFSWNTQGSYTREIEEYLSFCEGMGIAVERAQREHIQKYLRHLRLQGNSPRTVSHKVSTLRLFYMFLKREGVIKDTPLEFISVSYKVNPERPNLTEAQMAEIITAAAGERMAHAIIETLYATGCRVSELAGMQASDLDLGEGSVRIVAKGGFERRVPLTQSAVAALRAYGGGEGGKLFPGATRHTVANLVRLLGRLAKVPIVVTPHIIRHSTATHLMRRGAGIALISKMLGHKNITTTALYLHPTVDDLKGVLDKFHPRP